MNANKSCENVIILKKVHLYYQQNQNTVTIDTNNISKTNVNSRPKTAYYF